MKPLFLLVGPSGSGKSTIERELCERYGLTSIESYTDRPKRTPDEQGHIFVTTDEFKALGPIVTYTVFDGYQYGTTKECLDNADIFVVDPQGVKEVLELYMDGSREICVIGIIAPYNVRKRRMENRGDAYERIISRLLHDHSTFEDMSYCDLIVPNVDFERAIRTITKYMHMYYKTC